MKILTKAGKNIFLFMCQSKFSEYFVDQNSIIVSGLGTKTAKLWV